MENAWRVPFARFLKDTAAVEDGKSRFYLYWVGRWLSSGEPGEEALTAAAISRFIDQLGREEEPGRVQEAEEAIRLYSFFQERRQTERKSTTGGAGVQEWDAMAGEMTRIARLKHLSLRTERPQMHQNQRTIRFIMKC